MLEEKETPMQTSALPIYMCIVSILGSSAVCMRHTEIPPLYRALRKDKWLLEYHRMLN